MGTHKEKYTHKQRVERIIMLVFCSLIAVIVASVLLFVYEPSRNALGALGSVCMDVISLAVIIILVVSLLFEKDEITMTTRLFLLLMLETIVALFFDFLTWSSDGSLVYAGWTDVFTVCSLCCGSILAATLVLYLSSYMKDMYGMKGPFLGAKICVILDILSVIVTFILGVTKMAFVFVNGHYELGAAYDVITVVPILTIIFMAVYLACHIKIIGLHDVVAVSGYVLTMVCGALIEAAYGIGATYVGVAIADIFIFIMLQNKIFDRIIKQREVLSERISDQYEVLKSMSGIYSYINYIDIDEMSVRRFDKEGSINEHIDIANDPHSELNKSLFEGIEDELKEKFWAYTDVSTLRERMGNDKIISAEFCHKEDGWFRAQYIRIGDSVGNEIDKVIYAIRNIDEEKKNVEKWIRKSNTDELTGFFNRHAYEDEIASLSEGAIKDNFVYVSIDVNSLKIVNDSRGHDAGDELLVGACECMKQCFGSYGKLFRTGGDEFAALIFADDSQLSEIKKDIEEVTENWRGNLNDNLAISCGYVTRKEAGEMPLHQMAVLADKRMYEEKTRYYQKQGIDRRGQRDAHVALCALYTKILKINITDDSYQVINMDDTERTSEKGFSDKISSWLHEFGTSGQVHPEDLEEYLNKTSLDYMRSHFMNEKSSLSVLYRRKYSDGYKNVMMEMIPANDYTDEIQTLFLYVKNIE